MARQETKTYIILEMTTGEASEVGSYLSSLLVEHQPPSVKMLTMIFDDLIHGGKESSNYFAPPRE